MFLLFFLIRLISHSIQYITSIGTLVDLCFYVDRFDIDILNNLKLIYKFIKLIICQSRFISTATAIKIMIIRNKSSSLQRTLPFCWH